MSYQFTRSYRRYLGAACIVASLVFSMNAQSNDKAVKIQLDDKAHHTEDGFRNLHATSVRHSGRSLSWRDMRRGYAKMRAREKDTRNMGHLIPHTDADLHRIHHPQDEPQLTWIGHSTVLIQYRNINIITDPIFSSYCGPLSFVGPKRITKPAVAIKDLPRIDYVLISHNHYDHLDLASVRALGDTPFWLVPLGIKAWLQRAGINPERVLELDWWQDYREQEQLTITATPAQHWSRRGMRDYNRTLWVSWHLALDDFNLWFGGDTGYNSYQFVEIGERLAPADIALIPIGAYQPRDFMRTSHVDPHEAVLIFQDIKARSAIGIHWGTFTLSAEGLLAPMRDLQQATSVAELPPGTFEAPTLGRTFTVPPRGARKAPSSDALDGG